MRHVHETEMLEELAFAKRAAAQFAADPKLSTYTDEDVKPGALLALRWGLGNDCVLVVQMSEFHEPTIYAQQIPRADTDS